MQQQQNLIGNYTNILEISALIKSKYVKHMVHKNNITLVLLKLYKQK